MYLNRFNDFYTNGMGPRLISGGVAGAYSGFPNSGEIAQNCGYTPAPVDIWTNPETGGPSVFAYVVLIAVGVALGMALSSWAKGKG